MELPDLPALAQSVVGRTGDVTVRYPQALRGLPPGELRAIGEEYFARTRVQRKSTRPFFIDKLPNNFMHVGLIHLILPNARIIDARRHPLGCCFSGFKQHFARGQHFTYDLADLGAYYRGYVELMAHFDAVLPGRVHRVFYEDMVGNTEHEVRSLLQYCGLPFEPGCLRFYENERAVRTASSEQVRQPISVTAWSSGVTTSRGWSRSRALGPVLMPTRPEFSSTTGERACALRGRSHAAAPQAKAVRRTPPTPPLLFGEPVRAICRQGHACTRPRADIAVTAGSRGHRGERTEKPRTFRSASRPRQKKPTANVRTSTTT
jgi:hypothetical protein